MTISGSGTRRVDPVRTALQAGVYAVLAWFGMGLLAWLLSSLGLLAATVVAVLGAAVLTNWLVLRIYHGLSLADVGLNWTSGTGGNLLMGLAGGAGAACLVLVPPLLFGMAHFTAGDGGRGSLAFLAGVLAAGAVGEELLFRGYGFQLLLRTLGPWATIVPVGVLFAAAHSDNPSANWLGLANTAGFGIAFGYAVLRSRDLWLPIGLHFGWNLTLPLFGVNVSGLKMKVTGYRMEWTVGRLWSGGEYGAEASILTSAVLVALLIWLWKAPIRRQASRLLDPPAEETTCASGPSS